ncbi:ThiF family adenylyltransferase [Robbsia sp. KACC 23696]|uniref:ThiF family adenylyltransferase n=1 Tax=Robbsia sp. KACC 23696 TaxID=3149231 RepID=UPI00325A9EC6
MLSPIATTAHADVETALEERWPGEWRRLRKPELTALAQSFAFSAAWRLDVPSEVLARPSVDHLYLAVDDVFPLSDIRVFAPQSLGTLGNRWPHIESAGLMCLVRRPLHLEISRRVELAVSDAINALCFDEEKRNEEFRREAVSYWTHESTTKQRALALFAPGGQSRPIVYGLHQGTLVFAESSDQLLSWLRNAGQKKPEDPLWAWFQMLDEPLTPAQYPIDGHDIFAMVDRSSIVPLLKPPNVCPILLGMSTPTGPIFTGVLLRCPAKKSILRGFRNIDRLPEKHVVACYSGQKIDRFNVQRADRSWVHGRDHNPSGDRLSNKTVALIGCGALGSELARLLAQAGVGHFILSDHDPLASHNTSRHLLGSADVGKNKALALGERIKKDFPHIGSVEIMGKKWENLSPEQSSLVDSADLLITAGLSLATDLRIDRRRESKKSEQKWLVAWTEEFALAGHAVLITNDARLHSLFDTKGAPKLRMTLDWPPAVGTHIEAGCGNEFQPYGATDLHSTVGLAARLALDTLLDKCLTPIYRVWLGDRSRAIELGATVSAEFDASMTERIMPWP